MMRWGLTLALTLAPVAIMAQNVRQQREANNCYLKGVQKFAEASSTLDEEAARTQFVQALGEFECAYGALVSDVQQSRLMQGLTLKGLNRMDEALVVFASLTDAASEAVRERAIAERAAILEGLGEAEWAMLQLECGLAKVSVKIEAVDVIGANAVVADRLGSWLPCEIWESVSVIRPGVYELYMRREPAGAEQPAFTTRRKLDLGIGARQRIMVHFEVAPPPPIFVSQCGCNAGPECRPVRVDGQAAGGPRAVVARPSAERESMDIGLFDY